MRITYKEKSTDPLHPVMHGTTPTAKEFNRRQEKLWKDGKLNQVNFEQIATVLLEMFVEDYDKRHAPRGKKIKIKPKK